MVGLGEGVAKTRTQMPVVGLGATVEDNFGPPRRVSSRGNNPSCDRAV